MFLQGLEGYQDHCKERRVSHLVILKDIDTGVFRVRSPSVVRLVLFSVAMWSQLISTSPHTHVELSDNGGPVPLQVRSFDRERETEKKLTSSVEMVGYLLQKIAR